VDQSPEVGVHVSHRSDAPGWGLRRYLADFSWRAYVRRFFTGSNSRIALGLLVGLFGIFAGIARAFLGVTSDGVYTALAGFGIAFISFSIPLVFELAGACLESCAAVVGRRRRR
jgi:hypothetical protein